MMIALFFLTTFTNGLPELLSNSTRELVNGDSYVRTKVRLKGRDLIVRQAHLSTGRGATLTETRVIPIQSITKIEKRVDQSGNHARNTYLIIYYYPKPHTSMAFRDPGSGQQQALTAVQLGPYRPERAADAVDALDRLREP